jgi:hypothetical protein
VTAVAHGPGVVLVGLVALVVGSPVGGAAVVLAGVATWWRWDSAWLVPIGGAQAVLGPAGLVGPPAAAAASWLVAATLVLLTPHRSVGGALVTGAGAAFVVAGPAGVEGMGTRVLATAAAVGVALAVSRLRWSRHRTGGALVAALAAAVLAA